MMEWHDEDMEIEFACSTWLLYYTDYVLCLYQPPTQPPALVDIYLIQVPCKLESGHTAAVMLVSPHNITGM